MRKPQHITIYDGAPVQSNTVVTTEAGGEPNGTATIVMSSDLDGNFGVGATSGLSLTPVSGSVSISQQWNMLLFNVNDIVDAIVAVYDSTTNWVQDFFGDLFARSGNTPLIIPE